MKLTRKQRWKLARKEYLNEMAIIYKKVKKQLNINDEQFENGLDSADETICDVWEDELSKLQSKLENKYNCMIEHDDDCIHIITFEEKGDLKT